MLLIPVCVIQRVNDGIMFIYRSALYFDEYLTYFMKTVKENNLPNFYMNFIPCFCLNKRFAQVVDE